MAATTFKDLGLKYYFVFNLPKGPLYVKDSICNYILWDLFLSDLGSLSKAIDDTLNNCFKNPNMLNILVATKGKFVTQGGQANGI